MRRRRDFGKLGGVVARAGGRSALWISEAFSRGEVSYSKVRAITRIANAENEETLLGWARAGTASHIETLVRKLRRANRLMENEQAEAREASRGLSTWFDSDGMLVVEGRLTPEQGVLLQKALDRASGEPFTQADGSAERCAATGGARENSDGAERQADALALVAERSLGAAVAVGSGARSGRRALVREKDPGSLRAARARAPRAGRDALRLSGLRLPWAGRAPCETLGGRRAHDARKPRAALSSTSRSLPRGWFLHRGPARWGFRFLDRQGREVLSAPPTPWIASDPETALAARCPPPGLEVTPSTEVPTWEGERFDYGKAIEDLQARAGIGEEP